MPFAFLQNAVPKMSNWINFVQRFSGFVSHPTRMKVKLLVSTLAPPHNEAPAWTKWRARGNKSELMEAKVVCPCRPTHITPTWMQANKPDSLHYPLNWFMSLPLNWFLPEKLFDCLFIYLFIFPPCLLPQDVTLLMFGSVLQSKEWFITWRRVRLSRGWGDALVAFASALEYISRKDDAA